MFITNKNYTEISGKIGEELCEKYFLFNSRSFNIKNYYTRSSLPEDLRIKLKLDRKDRGTDAFIHHNNDKFSFIQCKFRTNINDTLDRVSITNMFSECYSSEQKLIENCYLFSTVLSPPTELSENEKKKVSFILYKDLETIDWNKFKSFIVDEADKSNKSNNEIVNFEQLPKLYEHQELALKLSDNIDKISLISACGSGKELIGFLILMRELNKSKNNIGLVLVPSLYLMSQVYRNYCKYTDIPKLLVGSDYNDEDDDIIKSYESNYEFPYKLTTDEHEIYQFLIDNNNSIIISTYQSCRKIYSVLKQNNLNLSITICDEAHLTATKNKDSNFNLILKDDFPTEKRIFMTATQKIYKGKNDECYSMDNEKLYGKIHNILSFRKAIEQGILSDYKLMLGVGNRIENLKVNGLKDEDGQELNVSVREYILYKMILKDLEEDHSRIIICSNNHKNSNHFYQFCKSMLKDTNVKLVLMKPNSNSKNKDKAIKVLKTENKCIIFQVRIFNLGVNVNEITTIGLLDDKNSTIDIIQTISRGFRKHPDKNDIGCRVLIPVVINEKKENELIEKKDGEFDLVINEQENFFNGNEFNNIKNILSSIALYDEAIKEEILIKMRIYRMKSKGEYNEEKKYIQRIIIDNMIDIKEIDNIKLEMFDKFGERTMFSWENNLKIVLEYMEKNNGKLPSSRDKINKGNWYHQCLVLYKRGTLSIDKKEEFDKHKLINPNEWKTQNEEKGKNNMEKLNQQWLENLDIILEYRRNNDNKNPSQLDKNNNGLWISNQYMLYKKGKLSQDRKILIENNNNIFDKNEWNTINESKGSNSKENLEQKWKDNLNLVLDYKKENNKEPTKSNVKNGGDWLRRQKYNYRRGKLSLERKEIFDKYKFISKDQWNNIKEKKKKDKKTLDEDWNKSLQIVLKYKENNNGNNPAVRDSKNGGVWISHQRTDYRKGKMTKERKKEFDKHKLIDPKEWNIHNKNKDEDND